MDLQELPDPLQKLEGLTQAQNNEVFSKLGEPKWIKTMDLLLKHRHLLEEDMGKLGGSTWGHRETWVASEDAAFAADGSTHSRLNDDSAASATDTLKI